MGIADNLLTPFVASLHEPMRAGKFLILSEAAGPTFFRPVRTASCRAKAVAKIGGFARVNHEATIPRKSAGWEDYPTRSRFIVPTCFGSLEVFYRHQPVGQKTLTS